MVSVLQIKNTGWQLRFKNKTQYYRLNIKYSRPGKNIESCQRKPAIKYKGRPIRTAADSQQKL
jgi:hypothetical protein